MDEIVTAFHEAVEKWQARLGLLDWHFQVFTSSDLETRKMVGKNCPLLAGSTMFEGQRRANLFLNKEANWDRYFQFEGTLEMLAIHELLHVVTVDTGFAFANDFVEDRWEVLIDRFVEIIGGEDAKADSCGSHIRPGDDGP